MADTFTVGCRNRVEFRIDGRMYRPIVKLGTTDVGQPRTTNATEATKDLLSSRPTSEA